VIVRKSLPFAVSLGIGIAAFFAGRKTAPAPEPERIVQVVEHVCEEPELPELPPVVVQGGDEDAAERRGYGQGHADGLEAGYRMGRDDHRFPESCWPVSWPGSGPLLVCGRP
jgi:hypothetical protein